MRRQLERLPRYGIELLVKTKENADALTECAPFTSEYPLPKEGVLYYLCEDGACQAPVRELNFI